MHAEAFAFIRDQLAQLPPRQRVVELGGRDFNGTIRGLFEGAEYTSVDLRPGAGVDVVSDAAEYTPPVAPDTVVCCEVLEHAPNAAAVVANALRVLAPGGVLLLTCATDPRAPHSGIDGEQVRPGEYYGNVAPSDLARWLSDATVALLETLDRGDLRCVAYR
jgi:SAM-dependent methyltransferase